MGPDAREIEIPVPVIRERPPHIPQEAVVDFDSFNIPGSSDDVQLAYRAFQQDCPDIFWTPHNGGHWVATRAEDIEIIQRDYARFSSRNISIPRIENALPLIPVELDPPVHAEYRRTVARALLPRVVNELEPHIRSTMADLIKGFISRGHCEFVSEFSMIVPVVVFLDLIDCPREDRHLLLPLGEQVVRGRTGEERRAGLDGLVEYLRKHVVQRRDAPGSDLLSQVVNTAVAGVKIDLEEAVGYATTVLLAGLDTVTSMLSFFARFLALNPGHRRQLIENIDDTSFKQRAIEELLRRHGLSTMGRQIASDFTYKGFQFREGEMILPLGLLFGLDERKVADPLRVDFSRPFPNVHAGFGLGAHTCPGAVLARRELTVFLEEWLTHIPDFGITPGTQPEHFTGSVSSVIKLELTWPLPAAGPVLAVR